MSEDYDAAVAASMQPDPAQSARVGFSVAADTNPDAYAEAQRVARRTGVPVDTVVAMPDEMKRQDRIGSIDFNSLAKTSPATAVLMADVEKAKIAHDDIDNLSGIESALYSIGKFEVGTGKAIASAVPKFNEGAWGLARAATEVFVPEVLGRKVLADKFAQWGSMQRDTAASMMPKAEGVIESSWYSGMQSLGLNVLMLPTAAAGYGMKGVLIGMGLNTGGSAYGESRDKGVSVPQSVAFGTSQGVIEAGTEMLGMPALFSILKPGQFARKAAEYMVKDQGGEQIATHFQDLNEWAVLNPDKTMADYWKARPNAALQTALATAFGGGGQVALMKGVEVIASRNDIRVDTADQTAELIGRLNEMAAANKVLTRDAGTFEQHIASIAENGPAPDAVFISAQTLQQSGIADQAAMLSPAIAEQYQTALETGGDVRIPIGDYAANIAPTPLAQGLADHLKFDPEGFTKAEAQLYMQEKAPELQAEVDRVLGEQSADETFKASAQEVEDAVFGELQKAGRFTESVNRTDAVLHKAFASVMGAKLGITPKEFFNQHTLRVIAEQVGGQNFDQPRYTREQLLDLLSQADTINIDATGVTNGIEEDEARFLSDVPAGIRFTNSTRLLGRVRRASETISNELGGSAEATREVTDRPLGPFSGYRTDAEIVQPDDSFNREGALKIHVYGREQLESGATQEPALTFTVMPDGELSVNGPTPGGETFNTFRAQGWADQAKAGDKIAVGWAALRNPEGGNLPMSEVLGLLADVHARTRAWKQAEKVGLYWSRATGSSAGLGDYGAAVFFQPAYHGSPYKFDKFSLEHMGKGEGAQAFGWGLYFAGKKEVAEWYRDNLSSRQGQNPSDKKLNGKTPMEWYSHWQELAYKTKDPAEYYNRMAMLEDLEITWNAQASLNRGKENDYDPRALEWFEKTIAKKFKRPGATYEVEIPNDDVMLDWDKPISEQPEKVKAGVQKFIGQLKKSFPDFDANTATGAGLYQAYKAHRGGNAETASKALNESGIKGIKYADEGSRGNSIDANDSTFNYVIFDDSAIKVLQTYYQNKEGNRGSFNPESNTIALLKNADLSTFLHESGHFFLEVQSSVVNQLMGDASIHGLDTLSEGERQILADHTALLDWFGIKDLTEWNNLDFEEKRSYHEQFARGFEAYLFEGKAPSIELHAVFQRFRAWLLNVYKSLTALNVELTDEVRGVFDRMLATTEQIQLAEQGRSMMPMFESAEQLGAVLGATPPPAEGMVRYYHGGDPSGVTGPLWFTSDLNDAKGWASRDSGMGVWFVDVATNDPARGGDPTFGVLPPSRIELPAAIAKDRQQLKDQRSIIDAFKAYHDLGVDATNTAIEGLQSRTLRDLQWFHNAHGRMVKKLQKEAAEKRRSMEMEARREIMSQPVYRAWQFLTGKISKDDQFEPVRPPKSNPEAIDETMDSLFVAIAKLGGLNKAEVISTWGTDPADKPQAGLFGKPVWRKEGGLSLDGMAEQLAQYGYLLPDENGKVDLAEFERMFSDELRGNPAYSSAYDPGQFEMPRPGEDLANPSALMAGRLDRSSIDSMGLPPEVSARVDTLKMVKRDGLHPDIVAEMFGFSSGDELVRALSTVDAPKDAIEGLTDQRMLEQYGDLSSQREIEKAADQAIHNDVRARMVATEANALAAATGKPKILASAAKTFAGAMIAGLKVRAIKPGQYASAEVRASKAAAKASKSGDLETAAAEKRNQLINNYATRAAYEAQDDVEKALRYLKKFDSTVKGLDAEYSEQIESLLSRFDLRKGQSLKAIDKRTALTQWVASQNEQGLEPDIPEDLLNEAYRKSYKDLTVEEFRGLVDTVKQIEHLGRLKHKLLTAKNNRAYEAVRDEIVASIVENGQDREANTRTPTTNLGRVAQGLKRFWASHIKAATWARVMDGGKDGGPMWEYFVQVANERGDMETSMRAKATQELTKILAPVVSLGRMGGSGQFFPSIRRSLNREARIALALNVGNEGNLQRLLGGEGWTEAQIVPVLQSLTPDEWQAVQAVWDHFENYRPEIAAKEKRVYGKEPDWVTPGSSITAKFNLRGGYYPIKYDPAASQRAEEHSDAEGAKRQLQGAYTTATTRRSFTKSRVEEVQGRPLLYTLSGLYSGVNDVIHDLAWHEWLIDTNRLLRSKTIDGAIRNIYGPEVKAQFKTWSADIAEGDKGAADAGEAALARLRQGVSVAGLGFNIMSAAIQPLGLTQSIVRVGAGYIGRGVTKYLANPIAAAKEANEKSSFMENRARTRFRELNELRNQVQDGSAAKELIGRYAYFLMMRCQQVVDVPTWHGAYEKAIGEGNDEERAINMADQAVIDAQGGGQTKDLSAIERGGPTKKLFTVFYSFMNTALNLGVSQTMAADTPAKKAKLASDYLMLYVIPPILGHLLKNALTPGDSGDDDPEKIAKKLAANQLDYLMGLMFVTREFSGAAKTAAGLEDYSRGYSGPAGVRVISDAYTLAMQIKQGEFDDAFRKALINTIGGVVGLPSAQVNRTITGTKALIEGETDNPAAVVFGFQKKR